MYEFFEGLNLSYLGLIQGESNQTQIKISLIFVRIYKIQFEIKLVMKLSKKSSKNIGEEDEERYATMMKKKEEKLLNKKMN